MNTKWIKVLYVIAGLYDGGLGLMFLVFGESLFRAFNIEPPNHIGYAQFPAALLLVFAAMFFNVAVNPVKFRALIPYGVGLKLAYCGTVFWNQLTYSIPRIWITWAWADLVFLILFLVAWNITRERQPVGVRTAPM
jgi:hypothetical protein